MKRLIPSVVFGFSLLLLPALAWAQQGTVTGTVTEAETGSPLPGATVQIVEEGSGAASDSDGQYRISGVPAGEQTIRVSFVGYQQQERTVNVPSGGTVRVNFQLRTSEAELDEVVVTALGVEQEERSLGYASSQLEGAEVADAAEPTISSTLSGQIPGLSVSSSSGQPGKGTRITIRGNNSYAAGGNNPLIVVDGMIVSNASDGSPARATVFSGGNSNRLADLDPNAIKNVNVLKGASATALYGSRASNGAIIIETKDGEGTQGLSASFTSSVGVSQAIIDGYQDEYLQGNDGAFQNGLLPGRGGYNEAADPDSPNFDPDADPEATQTQNSWGPHKDSVSQAVTDELGQIQTYSPRETFYEDALRTENSLTLSGSGDFGNVSVTITDSRNDGIVPTTEYNKTSVSGNYSSSLTEDLGINLSSQYTQSDQNFVLEGNGPNSYQWGMYYTPINFNIENTTYDDGVQRRPETGSDNPLWLTQRQDVNSGVKRFVGNFNIQYDAFDWLTIEEDIGVDTYTDVRKERVNAGTLTEPTGSTFDQTNNRTEINSTLSLRADQDITEDLSANLIVGNNISWRQYQFDYIRGTGIGVEDFFNIGNFSTTTQDAFDQKQSLIAGFGKATLNYRDYAYLTLTGRNDWSSTLPEGNRSYFYPSGTVSFIFTDAFQGVFSDSPLSFGKVRFNLSQVGNDTDPYQLQTTYAQANPGDGVRGNIEYPFRGVNGFGLETVRANPNLQPEITTEYEVGGNLRFFSGRANLDVTYYNRTTTDQIFDVPVSSSTGFTSQSRNAGEIVNRGWEVQLDGTALEVGDFSWDLSANWSTNTTEVVELAEGVENIFLFGFTTIQVRAEEGEGGYGVIYGSRYRTNGRISSDNPAEINGEVRTEPLDGFSDDALLIGSDGTPLRSPTNGNIGNVQPDWQGGLTSTFNWKGLTLSQQWEVSQGGDILNFDRFYMESAGTFEGTEDRGKEVTRDGIQVSTGDDNQTSFTKNEEWYQGPDSAIFSRYVEDASYVKLRELSLGYRFSLPDAISQRSGLTAVQVRLTGRNLVTFSDFSMGDPSGSLAGTGNGQGFYHGVAPSTRTYQASLTLDF
ncbi:SusC/RagA family TonB-linked outer membrane protein [Salinibacter sp.]|uniref:SusC/RagA family TonB-linked outer membrane protein n=1 Tax=Salinibacter sp. TaxID=2065818 RepID=UPI0021E6EB55|nr:SusC/RagA family TonB-linked outer membrane protein [Salinibacter sp.]